MANQMHYIDVDGHILEPHGLWEEYVEPEYRERTLKIKEDEKGLEYLSIDGTPSWFARGGMLGAMGAIGQDTHPFLEPGKIKWEDALIPGGYDPHVRVKVMDEERIDKTLVYPSLGLVWEAECLDPKLAAANCRGYNNWVFDFCGPYPDRLIAVAHIPTLDIEEGVRELRRAAKRGAKAAMLSGTTPNRLPYGSSYFDPLWAEAQDLDIPITIHPAGGPTSISSHLYPRQEDLTTWWVFVYEADEVKMQFTTFFNEGTFERFPNLKVVVLESGIGWLVPWIDRMDDKFDVNGFTTPMKMRPSEYFQRNCWIAMDPDDRMARFSIEELGSDRFLWAYDYPHSDSVTDPIRKLEENLAPLPEDDQRKVSGANALELYHLAP
ncbi:MAG: amidohydrolase family protein [Dehalococcoidia bacterium]